MNKYLILFLFSFPALVYTNEVYACNYQEIKSAIKVQNFKVNRSINYMHSYNAEKKAGYAKRLNLSKNEIELKALHSIEYSFESDPLSQKVFILLKYDTVADAIKAERNEKQTLGSVTESIPKAINNLNFSQLGFERIGQYVAFYLFGQNIKDKATPILNIIKNCKNFDMEHYFSKSTTSITFKNKDLETKQIFRMKEKELVATQDAMYTSELGTKNSLNSQIKVLSKKYIFENKKRIDDELELKKINIELVNYSNKSFFSVDVFVIYYDLNNKIIEVTRSISYTIKPKTEFEVESKPPRFSRTPATNAYIVYTISNPHKSK